MARGRPPAGRRSKRDEPPGPAGHLFDFVFFRALGAYLLVKEGQDPDASWEVLLAALGVFLMPDAIRGRQSPILRALVSLVRSIRIGGGGA